MQSEQPRHDQQGKPNPRGKYITLAILLAWVVGVFVYTLFNFAGFPK